ncbi:type I-E CRISPR-associated protein Cse2/CasB [Streptomyces sp. 769]|uniref:type I-E CRISPR-associated protein Cse2/CasB n=1 Tax=Streptomyces sp. 769 TaxID=1262452 RepID=UPI0005820DC4|nr:type I-E CRISPR-associated protein Cse2/CasB [Streptomyces sp. 769]AJC62052.1 CRISPR-associated protein, Cse2 family [Streptomyces sp. 769]
MSAPMETMTLSGRRLADADRFVARIVAACRRDTGTGQALRSALGRCPAEAVRAHRFVAAQLPDDPAADLEWAHYTVAALVALYEPKARPAKDHPRPTAVSDAAGDGGQAERGGEEVGRKSRTRAERLRAGNLGAVLGRLDAPEINGADADPEGRRAARLHALMREDLAGIHEALPAVMRLAAADDGRMDWGVLLHDLADWDRDALRDSAVLRWSTAYYKALTKNATGTSDSGAGDEHDSNESMGETQ